MKKDEFSACLRHSLSTSFCDLLNILLVRWRNFRDEDFAMSARIWYNTPHEAEKPFLDGRICGRRILLRPQEGDVQTDRGVRERPQRYAHCAASLRQDGAYQECAGEDAIGIHRHIPRHLFRGGPCHFHFHVCVGSGRSA